MRKQLARPRHKRGHSKGGQWEHKAVSCRPHCGEKGEQNWAKSTVSKLRKPLLSRSGLENAYGSFRCSWLFLNSNDTGHKEKVKIAHIYGRHGSLMTLEENRLQQKPLRALGLAPELSSQYRWRQALPLPAALLGYP